MTRPSGKIYTLSLFPAIDTTLYLEGMEPVRELPAQREHSEAAARLLLRHGAERVLVSLDRDGAFLLDREGLLLARAPEVEVRSSVGAGDAMLAWFTAALLTGLPREEALRRAVAAGSAACLHYGTHAPSREEAEALLSRVGIDPAGNLPD